MNYIALLISIFFSFISAAEDSSDLSIVRVTPLGENVSPQNQIVIQFNRAVVPLGDMHRKNEEIPVSITPDVNCNWQWINTSNLACNFNSSDKLKPATRYVITINPGIKAEDGGQLKKVYNHNFTTELPKVTYAGLYEWSSPQLLTFVISFNYAVTKESVEESIYLVNANEPGDKYKVKAEKDPYNYDKTKPDFQTSWRIIPEKNLNEDSAYFLKIAPGLVSEYGNEKGKEDREIYKFRTFPEFSFLGVKCYTNNDDNKLILIKPDDKENQVLCNPMRGVALSFSAPVLRSVVKNNFIISPGFKITKDNDPWGGMEDYSSLYQEFNEGKTYEVWTPSVLKAATTYKIETIKPEEKKSFSNWFKKLLNQDDKTNIKDEFGRLLKNPVKMSFRTDHRRPNYELPYHEAVLESNTDSEFPLYVNNLKEVTFNYDLITANESKFNLSYSYQIPEVLDVQYAIPLNIRKLLAGKSGAINGYISTIPEVKKSEWDKNANRIFVQVTPYTMQVKLGHFNSLVWVTDMSTGKPVDNAKVEIYSGSFKTNGNIEILANATTNKKGMAFLDGTEKLDPALKKIYAWRDEDEKLFVKVIKDNNMAIMPLNYDYRVSTYSLIGENVYSMPQVQYGHMKAWGTTAQGIYRVGDTIDFKLYVRNQDIDGLVSAPSDGYKLEVLDPTDAVVYKEDNVELNRFGAYSGKYTIQKKGVVGWYNFRLTAKFSKDNLVWYPMKVLVSDFTPSAFKVENRVNGDLFNAGQEVQVISEAKLYSGGAYSGANVRVTTNLVSKDFISKESAYKNYIFGSYNKNNISKQIFQKVETLNDKGESSLLIKLPEEEEIYYGRLLFETAVQDDRGKYYVATSSADYAGRDRYVGLKFNEWFLEAGKIAKVNYIVVDEKGVTVTNSKVDINISKEERKVAKVKSAGNAYVPEYTNEWVTKFTCEGISAKDPGVCDFKPVEAGHYRIEAKVKDTLGREHKTLLYTYVIGSGYVVWDGGKDNSLEIVSEKTEFKVGEKAKYLVKNPFPKATALITIERYGVIDSFVKNLDESTAIIEFDIKPEYIPGFYLSVVLFSPRVEGDLPKSGQVDLAKPTYKIGYVTNQVKDKYKELVVTASTQRDLYKPRDMVRLKLHAELGAKNKKEPIEFAVIALDEAIFDLLLDKNTYFDPYSGFYKLDSLDLNNYSLLDRLVGRQRFETKGANQGGGGGMGADLMMRNIFKFVSYWNPSVEADKDGNAEIEFTLPDNLTAWKILAIAVTPTDKMGLGEVNIKVNQPTEIRPVMPNQVKAGDRFEAGFSVMNRTQQKRDIKVSITARGDIENFKDGEVIEKNITLDAYKREIVWLPIEAKKNLESERDGEIVFVAQAKDSIDGDKLEHKLVLKQSSFLDTVANYGSLDEDKIVEKIKIPQNIYPSIGSVSLELSSTVIGDLSGSFDYMKNYSYSCWEQKLSKAIMAVLYKDLQKYLPSTTSWPDSDKLIEETISSAASFQAPNGGMSYFMPQDRYVDPYLSAYTAISFNWLKSNGYQIPPNVEIKLTNYLDNLLKRNDFPDYYDQSMTASIRAMALAFLAQNGKANLADIERFRGDANQMSLLGKNYLLEAMTKIEEANKYIPQLLDSILSYANQTSGKYIFSEELNENHARILTSNLRDNCAILSSLTKLSTDPKIKDKVTDIPMKLVRSIIQRKSGKTHWENTQENVFCSKALAEYASIFEVDKLKKQVTVFLDDQVIGEAEFLNRNNASVNFTKKIAQSEIGKNVELTLSPIGSGMVYYNTKLSYMPVDDAKPAVNSGIEVKREYSVKRNGKWEVLKSPYLVKTSEVVKVDIFLSVPAARNFVVVDDAVPGGLEPINRDLATSSSVDANTLEGLDENNDKLSNWIPYNASRWSFYYQELRHDSVRFYSDYLPAGNYLLTYTAQVVAPGDFTILPIIAQDMYDTDVYGKGIKEELKASR